MLIKELKRSQREFQGAMSKKNSNKRLIIQIIIITASNILCWIPSGIIYLISMFMKQYPIEMVIWTTIAVTPVNSIINPIVFVVTTIRKMVK